MSTSSTTSTTTPAYKGDNDDDDNTLPTRRSSSKSSKSRSGRYGNLTLESSYTGRRKKRQVIIGGILVGALLGWKMHTSLFGDEPVDTEAMYNHLTTGISELEKNVVRMASQINHMQEADHHTMQLVTEQFNERISKLEQTHNDMIDSMKQGILRRMLILAEGLQILNQMIDSHFYSQIVADCKSLRLPLLAIDKSTLAEELKLLDEQLNIIHYERVISSADLSPYYKHEFTSCMFNPQANKLTIILSVPIQPKGRIVRLLESTAIPFTK